MKLRIDTVAPPFQLIHSIHELLIINGYSSTIKDTHLYFIRRSHKGFDRMMPLRELFNGFGEGKISFKKRTDTFVIDCQFQWFLHGFTSLILVTALTFIFFAINEFNFSNAQLLIASIIIMPISIGGQLNSRRQMKNIIKMALNKKI